MSPPRRAPESTRHGAGRPQPSQAPRGPAGDDDWPVDPGRPLALRLLALVGAFSFLMIGLSVVVPLLSPRPASPPPRPLPGATT